MFLLFSLFYSWERDYLFEDYGEHIDTFGFSSEGYFYFYIDPLDPPDQKLLFVGVADIDTEYNLHSYHHYDPNHPEDSYFEYYPCDQPIYGYPGQYTIMNFSTGNNTWEGYVNKTSTYRIVVWGCGNQSLHFYVYSVFMNGDSYLDNRLYPVRITGVLFSALQFILLVCHIILLIIIPKEKRHTIHWLYLISIVFTLVAELCYNLFIWFQISDASPDILYYIYAIARGLKLVFMTYIYNLISCGWYVQYAAMQSKLVWAYFIICSIMSVAIELISVRVEYQWWQQEIDWFFIALYIVLAIVSLYLIFRETGFSGMEVERILFVVFFVSYMVSLFIIQMHDEMELQSWPLVFFGQVCDIIFMAYPIIIFILNYKKQKSQIIKEPQFTDIDHNIGRGRELTNEIEI